MQSIQFFTIQLAITYIADKMSFVHIQTLQSGYSTFSKLFHASLLSKINPAISLFPVLEPETP